VRGHLAAIGNSSQVPFTCSINSLSLQQSRQVPSPDQLQLLALPLAGLPASLAQHELGNRA